MSEETKTLKNAEYLRRKRVNERSHMLAAIAVFLLASIAMGLAIYVKDGHDRAEVAQEISALNARQFQIAWVGSVKLVDRLNLRCPLAAGDKLEVAAFAPLPDGSLEPVKFYLDSTHPENRLFQKLRPGQWAKLRFEQDGVAMKVSLTKVSDARFADH